jgi:hypothetical protein
MRLKQIENKEIEVLPPRVIKTYAIIESDDEQYEQILPLTAAYQSPVNFIASYLTTTMPRVNWTIKSDNIRWDTSYTITGKVHINGKIIEKSGITGERDTLNVYNVILIADEIYESFANYITGKSEDFDLEVVFGNPSIIELMERL